MIKKEDIIKIVVGTYKVTNLIPDNEPLRFKIRDTANDILAMFAGSNPHITDVKALNSKISIILAYFDVAKTQNYTDIGNFDILKRNYIRLKQTESVSVQETKEKPRTVVVTKKVEKPKIKVIKSVDSSKPNKRQTQVMNLVKMRGQISLEELKRSFPQVTPRTLRRDINSLSEKGIIQRIRSASGEIVFIFQNEIYSGHLFKA